MQHYLIIGVFCKSPIFLATATLKSLGLVAKSLPHAPRIAQHNKMWGAKGGRGDLNL